MKLTMRTRLTLAVSLLFLCMMGATSFLVLTVIKQQIKETISTEQFSLLSEVASSLEDKLTLAHAQLIAVAPRITPETLASAEIAQESLDNRAGLQKVFDNNIFLFSPEGKLIAEAPFLPNRRGLDLSFRPYIKDTLATSAPVISAPYISTQSHKHPVIMMTAPAFDREGKIIAILAGSLDLMSPNILGKLAEKKIGKSGYLYLLTADRTMIMHPDKNRIFKKIPKGRNPLYDRALQGFEGTEENMSGAGVPMLTSFKRLRVKNWLLAANFPQVEAYAPLIRAAQVLLAGMVFITVAAFAIIRYFSQYLTRPLLALTRHVADLADKKGEARIFHTTAHDETATLARAFNAMLEKLDRQQEDLRQREELYRTVTEFASDFIFWRAPDKKMIFVSSNCETLTGYTEEEFLADPGLLDALFHPEDRERWLNHVHPTDDAGKELPLEFRIVTKEGEVRWVSHVCTQIQVETGRSLGLRGSLADITERKQAATEQEMLKSQLVQAQKMESIGILAGGVAHDFNNSLNQLIHDLTKMLGRMIGEDVSLEFRPSAEDDTVLIDPGQMEQVLLNMAVNARDAMPNGGSLVIETKNRELDAEYAKTHAEVIPGRHVVLSVSDTGLGMSREIQEKIFDPFFTTKERGKGTGLGLAMVYGIIKQLGGHIFVYSEPEQGTTFKIFLPIARDAARKTPESSPLPLPRGNETILVVDDESLIRNLVKDILRPLGYTMLEADSGAEAIQASDAFAGRIDILLTDVIMPGMNGRELAEAITARRPKIKTIYMSGYTDNAIARHGVLGPDVVLIEKPITAEKLCSVLGAACDRFQGLAAGTKPIL